MAMWKFIIVLLTLKVNLVVGSESNDDFAARRIVRTPKTTTQTPSTPNTSNIPNTPSTYDDDFINDLEKHLVNKLTAKFRDEFKTCEILQNALGLEARVTILEKLVEKLDVKAANSTCNTISMLTENTTSMLTTENTTSMLTTENTTSMLTTENRTSMLTTEKPVERCPAHFWEFESHCYLFQMSKISWESARHACQLLRADLVSVTSQKEQDFIREHIEDNYVRGGNIVHFWLGLMVRPINGRVWVDGTPEVYSNWAERRPACMRDMGCHAEIGNYLNYKWEDVSRLYKFSSICEMDVNATN